jgi:hypothetical protein
MSRKAVCDGVRAPEADDKSNANLMLYVVGPDFGRPQAPFANECVLEITTAFEGETVRKSRNFMVPFKALEDMVKKAREKINEIWEGQQ